MACGRNGHGAVESQELGDERQEPEGRSREGEENAECGVVSRRVLAGRSETTVGVFSREPHFAND